MTTPIVDTKNDSFNSYIKWITELKVPEHLKRRFVFLNEITQFSKLSKNEIESLWWDFLADIDLAKMSMFSYEIDDQTIIDLEELKKVVYTMLKRSEEGFERKMQVSQYQFTTNVQQNIENNTMQQEKSEGFLRRLFRF
jgi:hypothetical protein